MSWALPYSTGDKKTCNFIHWNCRYIFDCDTITVDCIFSGSVSNRYRLYQVEKVSIVFEELIDLFFSALLVAFLAAWLVGFLVALLVALLFRSTFCLGTFLLARLGVLSRN